ncbi:hypothetical protein ACRRTK_021998 [Alexandromys fortis]
MCAYSEARVDCQETSSMPFLIFLRRSFPEPEVTVLGKLAGPWALRICLSHLPMLAYRHSQSYT